MPTLEMAALAMRHPNFISFLKNIMSKPLEEETVIEISVTRPGEEPVSSNIKLDKKDMALIEKLKTMKK